MSASTSANAAVHPPIASASDTMAAADDRPVAAEHPESEAHVAGSASRPGRSFTSRLRSRIAVGAAEPPARFPHGLVAGRPCGDQVARPGLDVELQFFVELVGHLARPEHVDRARQPGHGASSGSQACFSDVADGRRHGPPARLLGLELLRPAAVMS